MSEKKSLLTFVTDVQGAAGEIEHALLKSLRDKQPQAVNRSFSIVANDQNGSMVAGLTGSTSYGWLLVKTLWVSDSQRRRGIGAELMARAETLARDEGCHAIWLDTSSEQAQAFYSQLGFENFGVLENTIDQHPASHKRWFMKKSL